MCLAALFVEDIEDIYLFGTMITGFLLIGLGAALVYRRIQEVVTAVISSLKLLDMIDAMGRAVDTQTVAINRILDNFLAAMDNNTEKFTALQRK